MSHHPDMPAPLSCQRGSINAMAAEPFHTITYWPYTGIWQNNRPHGQGALILPNDQKYIGAWQNGWPMGTLPLATRMAMSIMVPTSMAKSTVMTIAYANSYLAVLDDRRQGKKGAFLLLMVGNIMAIGIKAR